jgi:hypothetical protein
MSGQDQEKQGMGWLKGCAIGCAVVVVLGGIGVAGVTYFGYHAMSKVMDEGKVEMQGQMADSYATWQAEGQIPEAHAPLFEEALVLANSEEATFSVVTICFTSISAVMEDGEVSEEEVETLQKVVQWVAENPAAGIVEMGQFFSENPELQGAIDAESLEN